MLYVLAQALMVCKTSFCVALADADVGWEGLRTLTFGDVESSLSINWGNA